MRSVALSAEGETALRDLIARAKGETPRAPEPAAPVARAPASGDKATPSVARPSVVAARPVPVVPAPDADLPPPPEVAVPATGTKAERLAVLRERVRACPEARRHCPAASAPVFGVGSAEAELLFVGEGPDAEEVRAGEPMVGPAGQILTKAIAAMGLSREAVYLADVMTWRTVMANGLGDRPPTAREAAFCLPYLRAQVAVIRPKVIVALGNVAVNGLLGRSGEGAFKVTQGRGAWLEFEGIPVMPTYHPSYLLHNTSSAARRQFWEDLLAVMERLGLPVSERQRGFYAPPRAEEGQRGLSE